MDLDRSRTPLADHPNPVSLFPGAPTRRAEQGIEERLAKAEHLIRTSRPAQALALLQAPGIRQPTSPCSGIHAGTCWWGGR